MSKDIPAADEIKRLMRKEMRLRLRFEMRKAMSESDPDPPDPIDVLMAAVDHVVRELKQHRAWIQAEYDYKMQLPINQDKSGEKSAVLPTEG